jgi:predicted ATPase/DNA-binding winged helix-turn-helix (wHTH) protein
VQAPPLIVESSGWEIDVTRRELRTDGKPLAIGSRAFEIVETLVQSAGELVTKDELMDRVWRGTIVSDNTLQVHISAVRKALGRDRGLLRTVSGRGYRLLGSWTARQASAATPSARLAPQPTRWEPQPTRLEPEPAPFQPSPPLQSNLPAMTSELVGRDDAVQRVGDLLSAYRSVTLTGPGGIGKTALALAAARELSGFDGERWLVELASLSDPELVPAATASVLGLKMAGGEGAAEPVARAIGRRKILLVLDNCEHVVESAAQLTETVLSLCPNVTVLATSREALRIAGEYVYRVPPLEVPPPHPDAAEDVSGHSAVQLFLARAAEAAADFTTDKARLSTIAAICRRLDGIPLAIEFAAARAAAFGVSQVAALLDDRFRLLTGGRRTALRRHQTLRAALDWSHDLLPEPERVILRRLAIFAGGFTLEAANAVVVDGAIAALDVVDGVANLVEKSLVAADRDDTRLHYRLLETTRAYALQKLDESGEHVACARRHAQHCLAVMEEANAAWEVLSPEVWLAKYRYLIDDVRAALDFSISTEEEVPTAVALTIAAVPLWYQLSLLTESYQRASRALELPATTRSPIQEMRLHNTVAWCLMQVRGAVQESQYTWTAVLEMARANNDPDRQLRALWGLWAARTSTGELRTALALAQEFSAIARQTSELDRRVGDRLMGHTLHLLGDQAAAREHLERMLAGYTPPATGAEAMRYIFDQRALALCFLARIHWLQGYPDQAMQMARDVVHGERERGDALSACQVLVQVGCPIGLMVGDLAAAAEYVSELIELSTRQDWQFWRAFGECYRGVLTIQQGDVAVGVELLDEALRGLRNIDFGVHYLYFLCQYAGALGLAGRAERGLEVIEQAMARSDSNDERWCVAEVLRIKGDLLHRQGELGAADATLAAAKEWAERQGALSWSLRIVTSTARLGRDMGRAAAARAKLAAVCARFTEGFDTADYRAARALLGEMEAGGRTANRAAAGEF